MTRLLDNVEPPHGRVTETGAISPRSEVEQLPQDGLEAFAAEPFRSSSVTAAYVPDAPDELSVFESELESGEQAATNLEPEDAWAAVPDTRHPASAPHLRTPRVGDRWWWTARRVEVWQSLTILVCLSLLGIGIAGRFGRWWTTTLRSAPPLDAEIVAAGLTTPLIPDRQPTFRRTQNSLPPLPEPAPQTREASLAKPVPAPKTDVNARVTSQQPAPAPITLSDDQKRVAEASNVTPPPASLLSSPALIPGHSEPPAPSAISETTVGRTPDPDAMRANIPSTPEPAGTRGTPAVAPRAPDAVTIRAVVGRYLSALNALDASAAKEEWPTVDTKALARAFDRLEKATLELDSCQIAVRGIEAMASCRGKGTYVPKIGNKRPRSEARAWNVRLRRTVDAWLIVSMDAR